MQSSGLCPSMLTQFGFANVPAIFHEIQCSLWVSLHGHPDKGPLLFLYCEPLSPISLALVCIADSLSQNSHQLKMAPCESPPYARLLTSWIL